MFQSASSNHVEEHNIYEAVYEQLSDNNIEKQNICLENIVSFCINFKCVLFLKLP